jgi:hypothetical protein
MTTIERLLQVVFFFFFWLGLARGYIARTPGSAVQCSLIESQPAKRRLEGWCEMAANLGPS